MEPLLITTYSSDIFAAELWKSHLFRELYFEGDVLNHPEYLQEAYGAKKGYGFAVRD